MGTDAGTRAASSGPIRPACPLLLPGGGRAAAAPGRTRSRTNLGGRRGRFNGSAANLEEIVSPCKKKKKEEGSSISQRARV